MSATPPPISPHALSKSLSWSAQYPSYQVDFVAQNTGRRVALTKRRVRWRFGFPSAEALEGGKTGIEARGEEHEVSLVWSLTSGKKSVVFDNQEVHSSDSRASTFEFSWSRDNLHVYKITAHATGNGPSGRQYDLIVDGQSYFDMPKVFELGLPNLGRQRKRLDMNDGGQQGGIGSSGSFGIPGGGNPYSPGGSFGAGYNTQPIRAPKTPQEEEQELQAAIRESLAESENHINRQKTYSYGDQKDISGAGYDAYQPVHARGNSLPDKDLLDLMSGASVSGQPPQSVVPPPAAPTSLTTWEAFATERNNANNEGGGAAGATMQQTPVAIARPVGQVQTNNGMGSNQFGGMSVITNQPPQQSFANFDSNVISPSYTPQGGVGMSSGFPVPTQPSGYNMSPTRPPPPPPAPTLRPPTPPDDSFNGMVNLDNIQAGQQKGNPFDDNVQTQKQQVSLAEMQSRSNQQRQQPGGRMPFNSPMNTFPPNNNANFGGQQNWMG